ncbi:MAG: adaptor protein MecA [Oscillospiraceae bacterium]|nr:adaptor protein MecA [Oscillospiraceae bacterium]
MTINKLSDSALKIYLDDNDFQTYSIDSSEINIRTVKKFLFKISSDISEMLNININNSKLYVEVFSRKNSCIIFVSSVPEFQTEQKNQVTALICEFSDYCTLESFCRTLNALYKSSVKKSSLYCGLYNIRLVLELSDDYDNIRYFASGYCNVIDSDMINSSVTNEYYKAVISENAIMEILSGISK